MRPVLCPALFAVAVLLAAGCGSAESDNPVVVIETNHGTIKAELYPDKAPVTVKNFLDYVDDKHYDGTVFHRVIPTFMIQGGHHKPGFDKAKDERELEEEFSVKERAAI